MSVAYIKDIFLIIRTGGIRHRQLKVYIKTRENIGLSYINDQDETEAVSGRVITVPRSWAASDLIKPWRDHFV